MQIGDIFRYDVSLYLLPNSLDLLYYTSLQHRPSFAFIGRAGVTWSIHIHYLVCRYKPSSDRRFALDEMPQAF